MALPNSEKSYEKKVDCLYIYIKTKIELTKASPKVLSQSNIKWMPLDLFHILRNNSFTLTCVTAIYHSTI